MRHALECIRRVASHTDRVILFHSLGGKDSIALLDLCAPHFREVVCVYMYMVRDLEHLQKYQIWAESRYPNARFLHVPHYALSQYRRDGVLGCRRDPTQRVYQLNDIVRMVKRNTGLDWAIFGFKQSDSLNRRLMLRSYPDQMTSETTRNAYPLSLYTNRDVLAYIRLKRLVPPITYGHGQSQGTDVSNLAFLLYCREYFPRDLERIYRDFPQAERILFDYLTHNPLYE